MGLLDIFRKIALAGAGVPPENEMTGRPEDGFAREATPAARDVVKYPAVLEGLIKEYSAASSEELMGRLESALKNPSKLCKLDRLAEADALVTVLCGRGVRGIDETLKKVAALSPSCGHHCSGSEASAVFLAQLANKAGRMLLEKEMEAGGAFSPSKKVDFLIRSLRGKAGTCGWADVEIELLSEIHEDAREGMLGLVEDPKEGPAVRRAALAVLEISPDEEVQASVSRALEVALKSGDIETTEALAEFLAKVGGRKSAESVRKMLSNSVEDGHRLILIQALGGFYEREVIDSAELKRLVGPYLEDPHPDTAAAAEGVLGLIDYEKFRRED